jgi:PAS domain S-box-containing protein
MRTEGAGAEFSTAERFGDARASVELPSLAILAPSPSDAALGVLLGRVAPPRSLAELEAVFGEKDRVALREAVLGASDVRSVELLRESADGPRMFHVRVAHARDAEGRPTRADLLFFDVSELAVERAQERASARRAHTLAAVAARISEELDLASLGRELCSEVIRALPVGGAALRVLDAASDRFVAVAAEGTNQTAMRPLARATVESFVARFGRAAFIADLPGDAIYDVERAYFAALDLRSLLYATIWRRDQLLGVLTASSFGAAISVAPDDVELLRAIADQSGVALANARLLAESRETAARYRSIVETAGEGIAIIDPSLVIRFANPRLSEMLGRPRGSLEGTRVGDHVFSEDAAVPDRLLVERLGGRRGPVRWRLRTADGRPVEVVTNASPVREDDQVVALVVVVTDVTETRRLEARLQQAQTLESLGLLAGGIAHDFNNLLTSVLGNADLARAQLEPSAPALRRIDDLERAARRAADLTKQLLAYTGKGRVDFAAVDLGRLVEEMGQLLTTVVGKGVELRLAPAHDLPPVEADATQLRQIVMNLITNASDAIGERGGVVRVETSVVQADRARLAEASVDDALEPGAYVALEVSDDGVGMSEETRARVFDPFFTTKATGRGLGLAATLGILRAHRGVIEVESAEARGSTFRVLLPVARRRTSPPEPVVASPPAPAVGVILVVDDEPRIREVTAAALELEGYEVLTAGDGLEALDVVRREQARIRLIVLDLTMPRMNGVEACARLRVLAPAIPIVIASGYGEHASLQRFPKGDVAGFLEKPFTLEALNAAVSAALRTKDESPPVSG